MELEKDVVHYKHFSHKHLLEYTRLLPDGQAICSCCYQTVLPGNYYYKCKPCQFYLHQVCFNMPSNVTHPSDPNHGLTLQSIPSASKISVKCKACEGPIKGFYYSCSKCIDYYHTLCLAAPLSMKTAAHRHSLNIEFSPVYDFQCDLCDKPSYSGWLYHCNLCEFDAHLFCVLTHKGSLVEPVLQRPQASPGYSKVDQKRDELMELLTRGSNLAPDQSPMSTSFQLSEACFSIDFQNSLLGTDQDKDHWQGVSLEEAIPEEKQAKDDDHRDQGFEESKRSEKSRGSISSAGIGAHIWTELEQETEKRNSKPRDQILKTEKTSRSCSSFADFFLCFFGESKSSGGNLQSPRKY